MAKYKFKVCLMGDPGVGKTSLIRRYVYGVFSDKYLKTIGTNIYKKEISVDNHDAVLMIWDIMGEETFRQILKTSYFYGSDALMAVGDITRKETIESLTEWIDAAEGVIEKKVPIIMVANKSDLEWAVEEEYLEEISKAVGAIGYIITSAKTGEHVNEAFETLTRKLLQNVN